MTIQELAALPKTHWRSEYPETFNLMVKNNHLESEALALARLTMREMTTLMRGGRSETSAWEAARGLFILSDPSKDYNPD